MSRRSDAVSSMKRFFSDLYHEVRQANKNARYILREFQQKLAALASIDYDAKLRMLRKLFNDETAHPTRDEVDQVYACCLEVARGLYRCPYILYHIVDVVDKQRNEFEMDRIVVDATAKHALPSFKKRDDTLGGGNGNNEEEILWGDSSASIPRVVSAFGGYTDDTDDEDDYEDEDEDEDEDDEDEDEDIEDEDEDEEVGACDDEDNEDEDTDEIKGGNDEDIVAAEKDDEELEEKEEPVCSNPVDAHEVEVDKKRDDEDLTTITRSRESREDVKETPDDIIKTVIISEAGPNKGGNGGSSLVGCNNVTVVKQGGDVNETADNAEIENENDSDSDSVEGTNAAILDDDADSFVSSDIGDMGFIRPNKTNGNRSSEFF